MKKSMAILAFVLSGVAIVIAMDPGQFAFRKVDVGGHQLRMLISGHGGPAVVFETGGSPAGGGALEMWDRIQPNVSKFTTTVSYDRAGIGWSEAGPEPRDARQVARELHAALRTAHVSPPYVLVGHSFGGPLNRVFAGMYPNEVAGMVLVEPTQEEFMRWNQAQRPHQETRHDREWRDVEASLTEAHESRLPSGIPIILITGTHMRFPKDITADEKQKEKFVKSMWLKFHREFADKLPNAKHVITEKSGHDIPFEEPELIISSIQEVINQASKVKGGKP
jgi:pimeloyl-ACP methyl ester carboxylesterase